MGTEVMESVHTKILNRWCPAWIHQHTLYYVQVFLSCSSSFIPLSITTYPIQGFRVHLSFFPSIYYSLSLNDPLSSFCFTLSLFLCQLSVQQLHRGLFLNKQNTSFILTNKSQALYFLWAAKPARGPFF